MAVAKPEMEVHALRVVKQEENPHEFNFPQLLNHTSESQYHDPTLIESVPLAKFQRALNPLVEQLDATVHTTPNVEIDNVHHTNGSELLADAASDIISASELEEPPNARATEKARVVAEMVEYAFATCEGSNYNPGTKMMVSNLLQFLSKQYEEDKALAGVKIERLKDEKMKLEEQHNLAVENFQKSESEIERLKDEKMKLEEQHNLAVENFQKSESEIERLKDEKMKVEEQRNLAVENFQKSNSELEELKKKVGKSSRDLEQENEELKTAILTMGVDMGVLQEKYNTVQSKCESTEKGIEKLKKENLEQLRKYEITKRSFLQQLIMLKAAIQDKDKKLGLQNQEMTVLRKRVGEETYHVLETVPNPPIGISELKQAPEFSQCGPDAPETEGPKRKKTRCNKGLDSASVSISGTKNAIDPQKFGTELSSLLLSIMTLGKALDCKLKAVLPAANAHIARENQWNHCISRLVPPGYRFETTTTIIETMDSFKMVWNHWISAVMFYEFEDTSFGLKEEAVGSPENFDASTKPGVLDGSCSQFLAFVKKKHLLLFPPWMHQPPLLKILDSDVYSKFKDIAAKIWMLHRKGRSCELPPSIFRPVPLSTRYDAQYHAPRIPLRRGTENELFIIVIVFMPGFVVGETVIKSQVAVTKM